MAKYQNKYRIESNRHRYWDYSLPGAYFITICTHNRDCFFGQVIDNAMSLSPLGQIVQDEMMSIHHYHDQVELSACVVMPNHVHMVVDIVPAITATTDAITDDNVEKIHEFSLPPSHPQPPPPSSPWWHNDDYEPTIDEIKQYRKQRRNMIIPKIVGKFKMITSKKINMIRNTPQQKNWQANYHDHIIRNDASYHRIQNYIKNNPLNWNKDKFHG